jgi:hypothetical protein
MSCAAHSVLPIRGNEFSNHGKTRIMTRSRSAQMASDVPTGLRIRPLRHGKPTLLRFSSTVPHKRLWRFTDTLGAETVCELETLTTNRVLLTVRRNGEAIVTETFADKRDALARSVGIYKEMKGGSNP